LTDTLGPGQAPYRGTLPALAASPTMPALVAEVDRLLSEGKIREAVLVAYLTAEDHLRQVYRVNVPRQWTHREFLRRFLRADMGPSGELLTRLHTLFEPVRYGRTEEVPTTALSGLVRALYREAPLRSTHLYHSELLVHPVAGAAPKAIAPPPSPPPE
jgi:hypothetical protein